ncbi:GMC oxidoreductase [Puia dinghuensis]|uniref:GMC family oxidoreductase n=1 Tax=Puia dinghuensis TaxID=1792502 RepID=A0A8J2UIQ2_9BACT|nr:GMC family oxidoreductase [Puia dinghuensis]GGB23686.1 GMC family oxidoreductase [Puia dinghuensis]
MPSPTHTFDAIVVGSGISGGWAAKELCEAGLKTLLIERGRNVVHLKDYPTANWGPWDAPHRGEMPLADRQQNPLANACSYYGEETAHFFVKDAEHPYIQEKPFGWIRGYQVGGKSLIWNRQTQRFSDFEFTAPARYGFAVDWPIRYADLAPWYSHVEKFIGVSANKDGLPQLPDGEFLPPWEMNCVEKEMQRRIMARWPERPVIIGRCAHITQPQPVHLQQGRGQCQARNRCNRGCPFGGYFSSNASTIPWAQKTGNLTLLTDTVVHSLIYDGEEGRATGVRVIDAHTHQASEYYSRIIFVNASALNTLLIMLNSTSGRFPNGFGNDNGLLGKYISWTNYRGGVSGSYEGFDDKYYSGRRPTMVIIPNFRNLAKQDTNFLGGYLTRIFTGRQRGIHSTVDVGPQYKDDLSVAGPWYVTMSMQGEVIPKESNYVYLSSDEKDPFGIPQLVTSCDYDENDDNLVDDFLQQASEMMDAAGAKNIGTGDNHMTPGLDIHEMGGMRMGKDPKTSLLNAWNQVHGCDNVFVTDGACMTSTGTQNPSLTYMALTARAVNHAVEELKKGNL